jgi:hypothetical protein
LKAYDLCLDWSAHSDLHGNTGRETIDVHNEFGDAVGIAVFSWYRMPSGRYEWIGYLA